MPGIRNPNGPKKGDRIKVEPIRNRADIDAVKALICGNTRDLLLFTLGINTNLRASDLTALKVGQVRHLKPLDELELREKKTQKVRRLNLNKSIIDAIGRHLSTLPGVVPDNTPLFESERGGKALTVPSVHRLVKGWCREVGMIGNYGSHTLRKTWGYHQRVTYGVGLPELMYCFNHSNQSETLNYLCIQPEEIKKIYANEL